MAGFHTGNRYLTEEEMKVNALYIYRVLTEWGWSAQAITGMLGNMETESTINPGIWQNLTASDNAGYGLVQWTPYTKYWDWCADMELEPSHMDSALQRIEWEITAGSQWIETSAYPMSFKDFKTSTQSPSYLAMAFLANYERPAEAYQPNRGTQADKWYTYITGQRPVAPGKKSKGMDLLTLILITNRG